MSYRNLERKNQRLVIIVNVLLIIVIALMVQLFVIGNSVIEHCYLPQEGVQVCGYQKVKDYLLHKDNVEEKTFVFARN